ncbi:hypothetical protein [Daejeonella oryzae]|uniref:hypothetical protein n=1 Tax=Daejeonella oryzae TaxID=1122943 RepID=UPI0003FFA7C7|nr:hypothetical protein [Daejeonella oryzae]
MESFKIDIILAGENQNLLVIPVQTDNETSYRLMKNGLEISVLKESGQAGWEVSGQPLNAEELDAIGNQIKKHS